MAGFVEMNHVYKRYQMGEVTITALSDVNFSIQQGEFVVIVGPSGAGKTTVLNILGGMDQCDEGEILVDGAKINEYRPKQLIGYRRYDIGFVFQFYNLIPNLTAKENVELASQICKNPLDAKEVLTQVGLGERMDNFPSQLSGGEQQRVAIAQIAALRRAHRRFGLQHRQKYSETAAGHLPPGWDDGDCHHPQLSPGPHGRPGDPV